MSQEDKRYVRDTHIRVDDEFDHKVERIRDITGIKTSSKAIRFAVDFTAVAMVNSKGNATANAEVPRTGRLLEAGTPREISSRVRHADDAESLRHVCVELELLVEDGRREHYLSEDRLDLLTAYLRELTKKVKEMLGA